MAERQFFQYEHPDLVREGKTFHREQPQIVHPKPTPVIQVGELLLPDEDGPAKPRKRASKKAEAEVDR